MHISLFVCVILFILKKIKINNNKSLIISIILIGLYSYLVSFSSSIRRAYIFFVLLSFNKIFKLDIKVIKVLIISICINIIIFPFIVYDIGFLYSCLTSIGIILSNKYLIKGNYLIKLFKVSLIAFLFSLPITINNFYQINLLSPLNNLFIVPLITLIIYPLSLISFLIPFLSNILSFFLDILKYIINMLNTINIFNLIIPKMNIYIIIIYYLILLLIIFKNKKYIYLLILLVLFNIILPKLDNNSYVYFFDVKQGDSSIIITPNQSNITLIDTGGIVNNTYQISDSIITFIHSIGINSINHLVLTHGDYDHMGEAINLVNNFKVDNVIFNCGEFNELEKELINVLDKKKIKYYSCIKELNIDNNKLYFLQTKEYDNENDNSNVIYMELNGYKFMFMGDAGVITEKEIMNKYKLPNIDVLKVGHHGSKTSSSKEFIDEINPKYSVISVGKNNRYGHPNKEVLNNLNESKIYRTDEDGSIMFKIKNNKLKIETCSP